jgi:hypothetical protein
MIYGSAQSQVYFEGFGIVAGNVTGNNTILGLIPEFVKFGGRLSTMSKLTLAKRPAWQYFI